jgi:hypothetical protein
MSWAYAPVVSRLLSRSDSWFYDDHAFPLFADGDALINVRTISDLVRCVAAALASSVFASCCGNSVQRCGQRTGGNANPEATKTKITLDQQIVAIARIGNATGR